MECPFKKKIIVKEEKLLNGDKIIKKETEFLQCSEAKCQAYDLGKFSCTLVKGVNSI